MFIGAEITVEEAISLWNTKAIFAYDNEEDIDWQINVEDDCCNQSPYQILTEATSNQDVVLYIEHES